MKIRPRKNPPKAHFERMSICPAPGGSDEDGAAVLFVLALVFLAAFAMGNFG